MLQNIDTILFDSGGVLNKPTKGDWFISRSFFKHVNKYRYGSIPKRRINKAFVKANVYINSVKFIKTIDDERKEFYKFFEIFSIELPELRLTKEQVNSLADSLVFDPQKYEFYNDVFEVIPRLKERYNLAVVEDAWPSLIYVFEQAKIKSFFNKFFLSSMVGYSKPNEIMFSTALKEMNAKPENTLFIDDNHLNCLAAQKLGIKTILICRDKKLWIYEKIRSIGKGYKVISSLRVFV